MQSMVKTKRIYMYTIFLFINEGYFSLRIQNNAYLSGIYKRKNKEKMNRKKWMFMLIACVFLTGCGSIMNVYKMDSKMQKIELGMTKKKVVSILGNSYETAGARLTADGPVESISYQTITVSDSTEGYYILSFRDNILIEWFKDKRPIQNNIHSH